MRSRSVILAAAAAAALFPAPRPASAGDPARNFFGADDRVAAETSTFPFRAIGKLLFSSGGHCTASIVAPRILLTAAHCLFLEHGDGFDFDTPTLFLAGYRQGRSIATAPVVGWSYPPVYDPVRHVSDDSVDGYDWAFLTLAAPIGDKTGILEIYQGLTDDDLERAVRRSWDAVDNAGYSADSENTQTVHMNCPILQEWPDHTFFHQCDELPGNSGGPLFIQRGGRTLIVGIASVIASDSDGVARWGMAVDARAFEPAFHKIRKQVEARFGA